MVRHAAWRSPAPMKPVAQRRTNKEGAKRDRLFMEAGAGWQNEMGVPPIANRPGKQRERIDPLE